MCSLVYPDDIDPDGQSGADKRARSQAMSDSFLAMAASRLVDASPEPEPEIDLTGLIAYQTDEIDKPDLDERKYRYLKLANNLQLMLISDPECDHAAACADVHVGSASDPEELPGLAHFLEHMLFLGTEKYPREDAYQGYLEQHGGSSNAFTQHENTTCASRAASGTGPTDPHARSLPSRPASLSQTSSTFSTHSCAARSTASPNSSCALSSPRARPTAR